MPTRKHVHEEAFSAPAERVFALLHTPSAIREWWSAARAIVLPERAGFWAAVWGDHEDEPDYITIARIAEFEPPRRMVLSDYRYFTKRGPLPFDADFVTTFEVDACGQESSRLRVTQDGFPADSVADSYYAGCETGWRSTFAGIRRYLEHP
jgi:uncharacterized protein YndB with AHSA1/START domain